MSTDFDKKRCFVHARAAITPSGFGVMTTQPLLLTGCDVFFGIYLSFTEDFGKTWSPLTPSKNVVRHRRGQYDIAFCDGTPIYHKASDKIILLGHINAYGEDARPVMGYKKSAAYAVFDKQAMDFSPISEIEMPDDDAYFSSGNGSGQSLELSDGNMLIPIYFCHSPKEGASYRDIWYYCSSSAVMRCSFDGKELRIIEIGNHLTTDVPRGLVEPSIIKCRGRYFLTLRNDESGFVTSSDDGLHFEKPRELCFDDGTNLGNYNTQQHWITLDDRLYLVYTRKGANNDHIPRHRAPLFIAEVDQDTLRVIRSTEKIAVPERGARLGNFCCTPINESEALIVAAEWMQSTAGYDYRRCMEFGSDNSIFITRVSKK